MWCSDCGLLLGDDGAGERDIRGRGGLLGERVWGSVSGRELSDGVQQRVHKERDGLCVLCRERRGRRRSMDDGADVLA